MQKKFSFVSIRKDSMKKREGSGIQYYRSVWKHHGSGYRKFDASDCAGLCSRLTGSSLKTEQKIVLAVNAFSTPLGIPNKEKERELHFSSIQWNCMDSCYQCCGSGIFIPDPDFYPSRIQKRQQKRGVKKFVVIPFFVATNFTKLKIILVLKCWRQKFGPIFKEL